MKNDQDAYSFNNITAKKNARRFGHDPVRRLRRQNPQLSADHAWLELYRASLSSAERNPRRHLEVSRGAAAMIHPKITHKAMKLPPDVEFHEDIRPLIYRPHGSMNEEAVNKIVSVIGDLEAKSQEPFNRFLDTSGHDEVELNFSTLFTFLFIGVSPTRVVHRLNQPFSLRILPPFIMHAFACRA